MARSPVLHRCWAALLLVSLLALPAHAARINGNLVVTGHENYCLDVGTTNAYACPLLYPITSYVTGARYTFKAASANTAAATLSLNGLAVKTLKKLSGGITTDLVANDIRVGQLVTVLYDGTNMQVLSPVGNVASPTADFASNTSTSVDSELVLFSGTAGKTGKRATGTGIATVAGGVLGTVTAPAGAVTGTIASGTLALSTSAVGSGVCGTTQTATATGTAATDVVTASFNADVSAVTGYAPVTTGTLRVDVWPSNNTVNVKICNGTASSITPGSASLNWRVVR